MVKEIVSKNTAKKVVKKTTTIKPVKKNKVEVKTPVKKTSAKIINKATPKKTSVKKNVKNVEKPKAIKQTKSVSKPVVKVVKKIVKKKVVKKIDVIDDAVDNKVFIEKEVVAAQETFVQPSVDSRININEAKIYIDKEERSPFIIRMSERNRRLLMWIRVTFCMMIVVVFWVVNLDRILKQSMGSVRSNNQDLTELKQDFGSLVEKVNQGVSGLNAISEDIVEVAPVVNTNTATPVLGDDNNLIKEISR